MGWLLALNRYVPARVFAVFVAVDQQLFLKALKVPYTYYKCICQDMVFRYIVAIYVYLRKIIVCCLCRCHETFSMLAGYE